jgi:hypothetical protein
MAMKPTQSTNFLEAVLAPSRREARAHILDRGGMRRAAAAFVAHIMHRAVPLPSYLLIHTSASLSLVS